ncbi:MAG: DUF167 domain-containing protein [Planctomycetes bacterium]|nr:DUF167 domain-containing protein [Planctomycetota bacterium]
MKPHLASSMAGVHLFVHVKLFSSKTQFGGVREDGHVEVCVAAKPKKGEANDALLKFLAAFFDVHKSSVLIVSGHKNRNKVILIRDSSHQSVEEKISNALREEAPEDPKEEKAQGPLPEG